MKTWKKCKKIQLAGKNILDLCFTNRPGLIKNHQTIPGISDHDIVIFDTELKAKVNKVPKRKIYKFGKANWDNIKQEASVLSTEVIEIFSNDINENWLKFRNGLNSIIKKHVPSKMTSSRHNLP